MKETIELISRVEGCACLGRQHLDRMHGRLIKCPGTHKKTNDSSEQYLVHFAAANLHPTWGDLISQV